MCDQEIQGETDIMITIHVIHIACMSYVLFLDQVYINISMECKLYAV